MFYEQLMSGPYYESSAGSSVWWTTWVGAGDAVVEFGYGEGDFLRRIVGRVRRTVGVDHNPAALERLRDLGIEGHARASPSFAAEEEGGVRTSPAAFQILEHLPRSSDLLEPAVTLRSPGEGSLSRCRTAAGIAGRTPSRSDCPPHHTRGGAGGNS